MDSQSFLWLVLYGRGKSVFFSVICLTCRWYTRLLLKWMKKAVRRQQLLECSSSIDVTKFPRSSMWIILLCLPSETIDPKLYCSWEEWSIRCKCLFSAHIQIERAMRLCCVCVKVNKSQKKLFVFPKRIQTQNKKAEVSFVFLQNKGLKRKQFDLSRRHNTVMIGLDRRR